VPGPFWGEGAPALNTMNPDFDEPVKNISPAGILASADSVACG